LLFLGSTTVAFSTSSSSSDMGAGIWGGTSGLERITSSSSIEVELMYGCVYFPNNYRTE
jgi:hypothetical protein